MEAGHSTSVNIPVSLGELCDKISILKLKKQKISDQAKLSHITNELELLNEYYELLICKLDEPTQSKLRLQLGLLDLCNARLWDIEDKIRDKERQQVFDAEFIQLARSVYLNNDERSDHKYLINKLLRSTIVEEKSYTSYQAAAQSNAEA